MGYFFDRESAEISRFDDLRFGRIEFCKTVESFVDRDSCIIPLRDKAGRFIQINYNGMAATRARAAGARRDWTRTACRRDRTSGLAARSNQWRKF